MIMDAETGAILAMASYPSYDANDFATTDGELFANPAVARQYEPGSVMKAFTVAAALDAGAITTTDTVHRRQQSARSATSGSRTPTGADHPYGHGPITAGGRAERCRTTSAPRRSGSSWAVDELYEAFLRFGFGAPTGIELAGEASGVRLGSRRRQRVRRPDRPPRTPSDRA